ncbi:hypothetical protein [Niveibacterium microcysteis]|uniref:Lipoprotein n=1 Tax=Niveibacterium microcysteis TaxID=2811415 RepID=A0ABX7M3Q6_9RHOO|nr:hypothetical protein [Niveibacterium microcysteis]QSI75349.1 hypothetical protein JY500_12585 [Niveibacterium microcysteis]
MNARRTLSGLMLGLSLLAVIGCSTPKPVLDLAGQGSASVGLAEASLRDYITLSNVQLTARMELMRSQVRQEARNDGKREIDLYLAEQAGLKPNDEAAVRIRQLGDDHRRLREGTATALQDINKRFTFDDASLPQVPTEKLAAAKKGFSVLAQELSPKEWVELSVGYAREIKTGVDKITHPPKP